MKARGREMGGGPCKEFLALCEAACDAMRDGDAQTSKQVLNKQNEDQEVKLISR